MKLDSPNNLMNINSSKMNRMDRMKTDSTSFLNKFSLKNDMMAFTTWYMKPVIWFFKGSQQKAALQFLIFGYFLNPYSFLFVS